jgi:hypothetical protein
MFPYVVVGAERDSYIRMFQEFCDVGCLPARVSKRAPMLFSVWIVVSAMSLVGIMWICVFVCVRVGCLLAGWVCNWNALFIICSLCFLLSSNQVP